MIINKHNAATITSFYLHNVCIVSYICSNKKKQQTKDNKIKLRAMKIQNTQTRLNQIQNQIDVLNNEIEILENRSRTATERVELKSMCIARDFLSRQYYPLLSQLRQEKSAKLNDNFLSNHYENWMN